MAAPQDLVDAVLQALRGSSCAILFGDTWDVNAQIGIQKFFADWADTTAYPQAIIQEIGEQYDYFTQGFPPPIPYLVQGVLSVTVYATDRVQARSLGKALCATLNDAPLVWASEKLMGLRMQSASFIPNPPTGPATSTVFVRQILFAYSLQGSL